MIACQRNNCCVSEVFVLKTSVLYVVWLWNLLFMFYMTALGHKNLVVIAQSGSFCFPFPIGIRIVLVGPQSTQCMEKSSNELGLKYFFREFLTTIWHIRNKLCFVSGFISEPAAVIIDKIVNNVNALKQV